MQCDVLLAQSVLSALARTQQLHLRCPSSSGDQLTWIVQSDLYVVSRAASAARAQAQAGLATIMNTACSLASRLLIPCCLSLSHLLNSSSSAV